ncbi:MAG: polyprenyl synthetase family protein [Propionibacteriaceae bacterium]|jgi:geranylgeranyl diphosphate synthase type I|nr:polyprenyl synthetase family protein [Propionibacteriaceae bacterium]
MAFDPEDPAGQAFRAAVGRRLEAGLAVQRDLLAPAGDRLDPLWDWARRLARGGKRLRPAFCYWGYAAVAGQPPNPEPLLAVAASLDLFHVSALVHDDIIDDSDSRRGAPSAHRHFARLHARRGWSGSSDDFGRAAAILLGDLLAAVSSTLVEDSRLPSERLRRGRPYLDAAKVAVAAGQYLDLRQQVAPGGDPLAEAKLVMEFKTSQYTVTRPVQLGAALGLADDRVLARLSRFGSHLGRAYQLRDDLLGVFGDPAVTGKPAGDDLREGKRTLLVAEGLRLAPPDQAARLTALLGDPGLTGEQVDQARALLAGCGAVAAVERAIDEAAGRALRLLGDLELKADGESALIALAHLVVERTA